jgi:hypothetical protein
MKFTKDSLGNKAGTAHMALVFAGALSRSFEVFIFEDANDSPRGPQPAFYYVIFSTFVLF